MTDREDIDAIGVAHEDIAVVAACQIGKLFILYIEVADGIECARAAQTLDVALLLFQIENKLGVGVLARAAALLLAAERLADGFVIGLYLGGGFGRLQLDHLHALALKLLLHVLFQVFAAEYEVRLQVGDCLHVGGIFASHNGSRRQLGLAYRVASARELSVIVHIRHDVGGDRVEHHDVLGFLFNRVVGNLNGIFLLVAARKENRGRNGDNTCQKR